MKVLFVAAEAAPLVKVGGLGDVAGSLPMALKKLGVDVRLALPWYPEIDGGKWGVTEHNGYGETRLGNTQVPVYLLSRDVFAKAGGHKAILATKEEEGWFADFSKAIIKFIKNSEWKPEVFHGHDWHVAEALEEFEKADEEKLKSWGYEGGNLATLLTIHNLNYHSKVLKKAIGAADIINAVSPSYAKEILTKKFCAGLCRDLNKRKKDIYGVLNGIDYEVWDPAKDELLYEQYGGEGWKEGKQKNKERMMEELGLEGGGRLLLGFVGRLDPRQKGVRILAHAIPQLIEIGCNLVVLGTGDEKAEKTLKSLGEKFNTRFAAKIMYDEKLAHRIYAGADCLLIPSKYEPCGLIQMIAMKYGTLPVAHAVGGLKDTIANHGNGFLYCEERSRGLVGAVSRVKYIFEKRPEKWGGMVVQAMKEDFSWNRSAEEYVELYKKAVEKSGS